MNVSHLFRASAHRDLLRLSAQGGLFLSMAVLLYSMRADSNVNTVRASAGIYPSLPGFSVIRACSGTRVAVRQLPGTVRRVATVRRRLQAQACLSGSRPELRPARKKSTCLLMRELGVVIGRGRLICRVLILKEP